MHPSIDIEYPHSGDIVGRLFFAGGEYSAVGLYRDQDATRPITPDDSLPAGSKVICRLYNAAGTTLLGELLVDLCGQPAVGFWDTRRGFSTMDDREGCRLRVILQVGPEPPQGYPADVIEDLDVRNGAGGTFTVTPA